MREGTAPEALAERSAVVAAAQYLRMSTDRQVYSIAHQKDAIARYAAARGFAITRSFADSARSGVTLKRRSGLQLLLQEVLSGTAEFKAILVYDVSRWGRFQDTDESAHYEFLCRRAGIAVHYCMEDFENDLRFESSILKSLKRVMAGEFSRELSDKTFASQRRLATLGYRVGGPAPLGLRRLAVDQNDRQIGILERGQRKAGRASHIVLTPGPPEEIELVRSIFAMAADKGMANWQIAKALNKSGIKPLRARQWWGDAIARIIANESYIGTLVYNKCSRKLKSAPVLNACSEWVRVENVFAPIIERSVFRRANRPRQSARDRMCDRGMLSKLRRLLLSEGRLSADLIAASRAVPSLKAYRVHFGSLTAAYRKIGYRPWGADYPFDGEGYGEQAQQFRSRALAALKAAGGVVRRARPGSALMEVDGQYRVLTLVARPAFSHRGTAHRLVLYEPVELDLLLIGMAQADGGEIGRVLLVPPAVIGRGGTLLIGSATLIRLADNVVEDFEALYPLIVKMASSGTRTRTTSRCRYWRQGGKRVRWNPYSDPRPGEAS